MNKEEVEYTVHNSSLLSEKERELLKHLAKYALAEDMSKIEEIIKERKGKGGSSIFFKIINDVESFFYMNQTIFKSNILRDKFQNRGRSEIKKLLLNRINCVRDNQITLPEKLFRELTTRINYQKKTIDVIETSRRHWEYILYKSINYDDQYYAYIMFPNGLADYSKILKLDPKETTIAQNGNDQEIFKMIVKKRNVNRP